MIPLTTDVRLKRGIPKTVTGIIVGTLILHVVVQACIEFGWVGKDFRWEWMTFRFDDPNPFDWFLSIFSHGNYWHWFGNMLFLWIFGSILEDRLGSLKFFGLFIICGAAADGLQMAIYTLVLYALKLPITDYHMKSLGASGAIAGIMGLTMFRFYKAKVILLFNFGLVLWKRISIPIWVFCLYNLFSDLVGTLLDDGIAHLAHIGGFFGGLAAARFLGLKKESMEEVHLERATLLRELRSYAEAIEVFKQVLALNPQNALAHQESGFCYLGIQNPRNSSDPNKEYARWHFTQALELYLKQGNYQDATSLYERLMKYFKTVDFPEKIPLLLRSQQDKGVGPQAVLTDDPVERRRILEENFKGLYHRGSYPSAHSTLQELLAFQEAEELDLSLLEAAAEVCVRMKAQGEAEDHFERLAKKGDERQTVRAMTVLARSWLRTPKQLQLNVLYRRAQERLSKLDAYDEWIKLGEQLKG